MKKEKGRQWDGVSRPSDNNYRKNFDRIFKTNPVAKEVRTSKFKSQIVEDKTKYNRKKQKTLHEELMEGFEQEKKIREEEDEWKYQSLKHRLNG